MKELAQQHYLFLALVGICPDALLQKMKTKLTKLASKGLTLYLEFFWNIKDDKAPNPIPPLRNWNCEFVNLKLARMLFSFWCKADINLMIILLNCNKASSSQIAKGVSHLSLPEGFTREPV